MNDLPGWIEERPLVLRPPRRRALAAPSAVLAALFATFLALSGARPGWTQEEDDATMSVEDYEPISTLVVPEHPLTRSKFPFIDVHAHLRPQGEADVDQLVREMDEMNMAVAVNLSGSSGERFRQIYAATAGRYPDRFVQFANIDFRDMDDPDWTERTVRQLEEDVKAGAKGLKIFKNLGMFTVDSKGERIHTDDPRIDPVWAKCGELGIPVLIHTGEPSPFWSPWDEHNERWLELKQFPNRRRTDTTRFASFEETMQEQWNVFRKHPETNFISAHLSWLGNDLGRLGRLLDEIPNMYVGLGAVIAEIGRQPRFAHDFFVKYQDRILMGKDSWEPSEYHVYFRILETADESFDYYRKRHAHWRMYGLALPDEVLRKVYSENARKLIPGIDASPFGP